MTDADEFWYRIENPDAPGDSLAQGYEKACDIADIRATGHGRIIRVFSIAFRGGRKHLRYTAKPKPETIPSPPLTDEK